MHTEEFETCLTFVLGFLNCFARTVVNTERTNLQVSRLCVTRFVSLVHVGVTQAVW